MRRKWEPQLSMFHSLATHEIAKELAAVSRVLDDNGEIMALGGFRGNLWHEDSQARILPTLFTYE